MIRVDGDRLHDDFLALAEIGRLPEGGVSRTTFSDAHLEARAWFQARAGEAGLQTHIDPAGNHSAVLPASPAGSQTLLLGSHLDTVPVAGRYDGALGVVAGLEVLRAVKDSGRTLPVSLEAIDFTDEEGSLVGLLGSFAVAGSLPQHVLEAPRGGLAALHEGLARAGLCAEQLSQARRNPQALVGYLELHIEQGPVLERTGRDIGVVSAIAGSRSYRVELEGARRHAGTTPMDARRDALLGAAGFATRVRDIVAVEFPGCVGTVGGLEVERPAFNVVPGRVKLLLELRAPTTDQLDALESAVFAAAERDSSSAGLTFTAQCVGRWEPVDLDLRIQELVTEAAGGLGLTTLGLNSGAGHDAQALAAITPTGMIFVPSLDGVSHDPAECTPWDDCVNGANVLLASALRLAGERP